MTTMKLKPKKDYSEKYHAKYQREYRKKHPENVIRDRQKRKHIRLELMDLLGGRVCCFCGYDADVRALQIDHINGGGSKERRFFKNFTKMYQYYLKNPSIAIIKLQVLCSNCNIIKQHDKKQWNPPSSFQHIGQRKW